MCCLFIDLFNEGEGGGWVEAEGAGGEGGGEGLLQPIPAVNGRGRQRTNGRIRRR